MTNHKCNQGILVRFTFSFWNVSCLEVYKCIVNHLGNLYHRKDHTATLISKKIKAFQLCIGEIYGGACIRDSFKIFQTPNAKVIKSCWI